MNTCLNCIHYVHGIDACMVHGYDHGRYLPDNGDPCPEFELVPEINPDQWDDDMSTPEPTVNNEIV